MNITERQRELAEWFFNTDIIELSANWKSSILCEDDAGNLFINNGDPVVGPWLDADWCFEFFKKLSLVSLFINNQDDSLQIVTDGEPWDGESEEPDEFDLSKLEFGKSGFFLDSNGSGNTFKILMTNTGSLTQQLQEATKQAIEWLPEESKKVIEGMK